MDFIKENFNFLISHIKKNSLDFVSDDNFIFKNKFDNFQEKYIFFLGASVNQDKTPQNKISFGKSIYSKNNNIFDIYYALHIPEIEEYINVLRILIDFPNDNLGNKFEILNNSSIDINENFYIKFFLSKINNEDRIFLSNFIFIKSEMKIITLHEIPKTSKVSEVLITTKRK